MRLQAYATSCGAAPSSQCLKSVDTACVKRRGRATTTQHACSSPKPKRKTRERSFLRGPPFHIDIHQPHATPSTPNTPYRARQSKRDDDGKRGRVVGGRGRQHARRFFSSPCQRGSLVALGTQGAPTRGLLHVHGARHKEERHDYVGLQSQRRDEGTCCVCVCVWKNKHGGKEGGGAPGALALFLGCQLSPGDLAGYFIACRL